MASGDYHPSIAGTSPTTYSMEVEGRKRRQKRVEEDAQSLTYSAGSSIQSGNSSTSAAGESTDSSFADIMRVLDLQDSKELVAYYKKEVKKSNMTVVSAGNTSTGSSLQYSTDGESALNGEHLLQTITGQPSDSLGPDGGGLGLLVEEEPKNTSSQSQSSSSADSIDIMFAEADPDYDEKKAARQASFKEKKQRKKRSKAPLPTPKKAPNKRGVSKVPKKTPLPPRQEKVEVEEEVDVWYTKWWMCGFQDAFRDLVDPPKRK
eukprot:CAMPEP_0116836504 /NCGR_PEP_ID=MMETSP0418-20121206/8135_1 /TAXON_ID=1158023 /ORGANISM="Astrosyne radiata, Strain 13vi08-1A" /LENGTH=261 /DNA_ID=CAMNT_0004466285 /DNA_START=168 /DNA_END=953 /DNA_ORIENTATION=+